jgi:hypothetical protein
MVYTLTVHLLAKDDPDCIRKLRNKLIEASRVYSQDKETLSWFVMQSVKEEREFTIVERYERESVSPRFKWEVLNMASLGGLLLGYGRGSGGR